MKRYIALTIALLFALPVFAAGPVQWYRNGTYVRPLTSTDGMQVLGHSAFGNNSGINGNVVYVNETWGPQDLSGGRTDISDISTFAHTGSNPESMQSVSLSPTITTDSIGPIASFTALGGTVLNRGSGEITNLNALLFEVDNGDSGTSGSTVDNAFGVNTTINNFSGTIPAATGFYTKLQNLGAGSITTGYGLHIDSAYNENSLGTYYGIKIEDQTAATNNYALITGKGTVGIGTTSPFAKLSIHANNGDTNSTLFAIGSSTASGTTTLFSVSNTGSTTASNGFNITAGCYAIGGTCLSSGGGGTGASTTLLADSNTWTGTNTFSTTKFSTMTSGSVLFAGASGLLSQDNSKFFWDNTGKRLAIGSAAPVGKKLDIFESRATNNTGNSQELSMYSEYTPTSNETTYANQVAYFEGHKKGNFNALDVRGFQSLVSNDGAGTLSALYGSFNNIQNIGGAVTSGYGSYVGSPIGGGTITTAYGHYVEPQKVSGVGTGYGFYSAGTNDINYFGGKVGVGTTSPFSMLSVSSTTQTIGTLPLFTVASTTNATLFTVLGNGNISIGTTTNGYLTTANGNGLLSVQATPIPVTDGGTGLSSFSVANRIPYSTSGTSLTTLAMDITATRYLSNQGTANAPSWNQVNLANGVTGTLPVANGGTGKTTFTTNLIPYGNGTGALKTSSNLVFDGSNLMVNTAGTAVSTLNVGGSLALQSPGDGGQVDIKISDFLGFGLGGGIRVMATDNLTSTPDGAAIQFFNNNDTAFPGQFYMDSGANDSAALIFRTTGTGGTISERLRITANGHMKTTGTRPGVSACGTSPTIFGNDIDFHLYAGTTLASSCTVTFAAAYAHAPVCTLTQQTGTALAVVASSTPTTLVISGGTFTGDRFAVHCEEPNETN